VFEPRNPLRSPAFFPGFEILFIACHRPWRFSPFFFRNRADFHAKSSPSWIADFALNVVPKGSLNDPPLVSVFPNQFAFCLPFDRRQLPYPPPPRSLCRRAEIFFRIVALGFRDIRVFSSIVLIAQLTGNPSAWCLSSLRLLSGVFLSQGFNEDICPSPWISLSPLTVDYVAFPVSAASLLRSLSSSFR